MLEAVFPYLVALLLLGAMLALPHANRPMAGVAAAFILLLLEPHQAEDGTQLVGPSTIMALFILIAVAVVLFGGSWRQINH